MTNTVLYGYLIGWAMTSIGLALTTRQHAGSTPVVVVAGAAWPLLLVGVAQIAAVALVAEVARFREPGPKSIDEELEELLRQCAIDYEGAPDRRLPVAIGSDNTH